MFENVIVKYCVTGPGAELGLGLQPNVSGKSIPALVSQ